MTQQTHRNAGTKHRCRARTRLPGDASAPARARVFVSAEVTAETVQVDDVVLVASELVTNAVKAGSTSIDLVLHDDETGFELSVEEDADGFPQQRAVTADSLGGRGLAIVAELADTWTATPACNARGKRVTARWQVR